MKDKHEDVALEPKSDVERMHSMLSVLAEALTNQFIEKGACGNKPNEPTRPLEEKCTHNPCQPPAET
jgi:hypothetical protein